MSEQPADVLTGVEGEIKWFDNSKGYGFIIGPRQQDILVHYSVITGRGYRSLRDGAAVEYDARLTERGWKATRVVRLSTVATPMPDTSRAPRTPRQ